ncbi:MAG: DUF58 domain-containing protein [Vicinamibacterales bacterium]
MSRHHLLGPEELSALRDLELVARTTVEGLRQGQHRSPFHGFSAEFHQYRHYRPGDDLKYVDWKAFGRTDRLYTRQFRETTNLSALVVLDVSRSMAFPPVPDGAPLVSTKHGLARAAAAALAALIVDQGDQAGLLALGQDITWLPPRSGRPHLRQMLAALARLVADGETAVGAALARAAAAMKRKGLIIVVSDFYDEEETIAEIVRLAHMGHDLLAVHVMAREELALGGSGAGEFEDLETGERVVLDVRGHAAAYAETVAAFLRRIESRATAAGIAYLRLTTGEALEPALRRFLIARRGGA